MKRKFLWILLAIPGFFLGYLGVTVGFIVEMFMAGYNHKRS